MKSTHYSEDGYCDSCGGLLSRKGGIEYCLNCGRENTPPARNQLLIVHQAYKIGQSQYGLSQWRIAFLCATRGLVEIYRSIHNVSDESDQAALVRAEIAKFRNN